MLSFIDDHSNNEYRFYSFNNMYLSGLQKGLQTAHVVAEMSNTIKNIFAFADAKNEFKGLHTDDNVNELQKICSYNAWKAEHKTIIMLDGGNSAALQNILNIFDKFITEDNVPLAVTYFHESEGALNCALTCVGIILPKCIYEHAAYLREGKDLTPYSFTNDKIMSQNEKMFFKIINSCRLSI